MVLAKPEGSKKAADGNTSRATSPGGASDVTLKLERMRRVLEQKDDGSEDVQDKQLTALLKLYKMSLSTTTIIDSQIGVPVSKLRKSR